MRDTIGMVPYGGNNELHENIGNGTFRLVTTTSISSAAGETKHITMADVDNDGDVRLSPPDARI